MDPCPFVRLTVESLALKLPFASRPAGPGVHPSTSPCFCKIRLHNFSPQTTPLPLYASDDVSAAAAASPTSSSFSSASGAAASSSGAVLFQLDPATLSRLPKSAALEVAVYTGRMGATCGFRSGKLLGRFRVDLDLSGAETRACVYHNGWTKIGKHGGEEEKEKERKPSARLHLLVRSESEPRFVFQFGGEPECSPVVFQIQGNIRQPVFTCKFTAPRSLQLDYTNTSSGWMMGSSYRTEKERYGRERKGWRVMIFDLSGSPVAAASMTTPFVPSPGLDRVSRSNPGAWLILRPNGFSDNNAWKPWARLEAWREKRPIDALGYKLELITDSSGPAYGHPIAESQLSVHKGGLFCIDGRSAAVGVRDGLASASPAGSASVAGFVMGATVEGEGKVSKPTVEVGTQHVACMGDAALFVALSAAVDLSMDACRLFSHKLRKELSCDRQDSIS
ncbi:hypothetical protein H6P81_000986 [Aristolochia fimbriata]|uniref:Rhodanese domain-containing protein n=1 Tax=Aristolochia fimbriata TaxID=158543 RepID=A0AAV7F664_ARIFI|nr:hypothetical protein H6P81_000986 [Aristolochia fimbriata]